MHKTKFTTSTLLLISLVFMSCFAALTYHAFHVNTQLRFDAETINKAGIIRGSIQRFSKMALVGCEQKCPQIKQLIDEHLTQFIDAEYHTEDVRSYSAFRQKLIELRALWLNLYKITEQFHLDPSAANQKDLVDLSELLWALADQTVYVAQRRSEEMHTQLTFFYPMILFLFISSAGLLILVFKTVRFELEYHVGKDPLTGLNNRRVFNKELVRKVDSSKRYGNPLSLLYIDIDHFKEVNDQHGHACGDKILKELAKLVASNIRKVDIFCRIGGEEFAIIVPDTDLSHCLQLAKKLLNETAQHSFAHQINITASIGICAYDKTMNLQDFINSADNAMYKAKHGGRNRIEVHTLEANYHTPAENL